jgi:hypothetical protein
MASSSKGRASSRKQSSAGKARVISTRRKDALPRTGSAVAVPKKKAHSLLHKEPTASRKKTTRAEALAVVETEFEVEASAILEELPVEAAIAPSIAIGPPPIPEETRTPPVARTTAAHPAPARPAPHHERRSLMPAIGRLLSALCRWTGVSGTK